MRAAVRARADAPKVLLARGEAPPRRRAPVPSPLPDVPAAAWDRFREAMATGQPGAVSASGCYGRYEMRPRRLGDLGLMTDLKAARDPIGRQVTRGLFRPPLTEAAFLASEVAQYGAFCRSIERYDEDLRRGRLSAPAGLSRSAALAVLHRAGPGALARWPERRFSETAAAVARAADLF